MARMTGWSAEIPSWALPVTVPGVLVLIRGGGMLAYVGPVCAYQAGFEFSLAVSLNPDRADVLMAEFSGLTSTGGMPMPRVCVGFDGVVVDSAGVESWRFIPGQPLLRDCGWSSSVLVGQLNPRHVSRWWVSPLPVAGPVEFTVSLPGRAGWQGSARMDAGQITGAARRSAVLWAEAEPGPDPR
jgi:hypothetical protein